MNKSSLKTRLFFHRVKQHRLETGFSMLEAVVVVGVLLALAVGGFFAYGPITENAKMAKVKSTASAIHTAVVVASIDGDASTLPQDVIDSWNASTDKIRVGIISPTAGETSANGDFCVSATNVDSPQITARTGACDGVTGGSNPGGSTPGDIDGDGVPNGSDPDIDGDGIPNSSDPDIDGDGIPNGSDPTPNGEIGNGSDPGNVTPPTSGSGFQFNPVRVAGIVTAFGDNREKQAGPGSYGVYSPVTIGGVLAGKAVSDVSAGAYHGCALLDGAPYCWGANWAGETGGSPSDTGVWNYLTPNRIDTTGVLAGKTLVSITAGEEQSCTLDTEGKAYCWGAGATGQLGNGTDALYENGSPVAVNIPVGEKFVKIVVGYETACGLSESGSAYCWGWGYYGLGDGIDYPRSTSVLIPVKVSGLLEGKKITDIDTNDYAYETHACAIAEGKAYCWGQGFYGQLGDGNRNDTKSPVAVDTSGVLAGKTLTMITIGGVHSCALDTAGEAYCWGSRDEVGDGSLFTEDPDSAAVASPVKVAMTGELAGKTVKSISAGAFNTYLVSSDNKVYSWGQSWNGSLGDGQIDSPDSVLVPTPLDTSGALAGKEITGVSGGGFFAYVTYKP